ncbi:hypothetical protein [Providencia rettgeri]
MPKELTDSQGRIIWHGNPPLIKFSCKR